MSCRWALAPSPEMPTSTWSHAVQRSMRNLPLEQHVADDRGGRDVSGPFARAQGSSFTLSPCFRFTGEILEPNILLTLVQRHLGAKALTHFVKNF